MITGKPSKQAKVTPGLQPLQPALDTLTKQYGEQEFALVDRVSISGRSREKVQNASSKLQVSHFASLQGDIVDADIDLDGWKGADIKLRARLNAQLGKFVVVGDSQPEAGVTQYYILRATTL